MNGWFKFHRKMLDHAVWSLSPAQFKVWVTCLAMAAHKLGDWFDGQERIEIPSGCWITSQDHLAQTAGVGRQVVRDALRNLERIGSIRTKTRTKHWTLIEVVNWPTYQGAEADENQEENLPGTKGEPRENHIGRMKEGKKKEDSFADACASARERSSNKPRKTHPETDALLAEFGARFEQKWGTPYLATFARDKKLLHDMLTASGVEEVRTRMVAFLTYGTKRTRDQADYSIPAFRAAWNELGVLKARGDL